MAKLERITNKIFGENATATGDNPNIGQFGSALAGTYVGTTDVATIQSLPAWGQGWIGAVTPTQQFPALPEMTGAMKVLSYQTAYNQQMGIPEYDNATVYYTNSFCQVDGVIYKSTADENQGNDPTEENSDYWEPLKLGGGSSMPLLSCMWSDHLLNDIQWLRADTFSWQDGSFYSAVYNKLVEEYTAWGEAGGVVETENGVAFARTPNGYKITASVNEQAVINAYNSTGVAWYYILDTENKRFKLPRTKFGFVGYRNEVGKFVDESLPQHNHTLSLNQSAGSVWGAGGAYWGGDDAKRGPYTTTTSNANSSTYKDGAPVQQKSTQMYLYFYVGEYSQTAIEQTAGLNAELFNNKVDLSSSFGFPRGDYFNIGVGASGTQYTAPANGYIQVNGAIGSGGGMSEIIGSSIDYTYHSPNVQYARYFVPIKKGAVFTYVYQNFNTEVFRFIYAEGAN